MPLPNFSPDGVANMVRFLSIVLTLAGLIFAVASLAPDSPDRIATVERSAG